MLSAYRSWLESELKLLGNASHHAYSFGQANMAKRALEHLDETIGDRVPVLLERADVSAVLTELELQAQRGALAPALAALREALVAERA